MSYRGTRPGVLALETNVFFYKVNEIVQITRCGICVKYEEVVVGNTALRFVG